MRVRQQLESGFTKLEIVIVIAAIIILLAILYIVT